MQVASKQCVYIESAQLLLPHESDHQPEQLKQIPRLKLRQHIAVLGCKSAQMVVILRFFSPRTHWNTTIATNYSVTKGTCAFLSFMTRNDLTAVSALSKISMVSAGLHLPP